MDTRMSTETVNLATRMRIMLMATPMAMHTDIRMEVCCACVCERESCV